MSNIADRSKEALEWDLRSHGCLDAGYIIGPPQLEGQCRGWNEDDICR